MKPHNLRALKLTLTYALFGALWIALSDSAILLLTDDPGTLTRMQNYKGWLYVVVTGALVWFLASRALGQQASLMEQVQISDARFRSIFQHANDGILIHDLETDRVVETNPRMRRMFGCTRNQAGNLSIEELSAAEPADNLATARQHIAQARQGQASSFEWNVRRPGGGNFWAEVTIRSTTINRTPHCIMVIRDVSERKAAFERLRLAAAVFESARDGIVITDARPTIIAVNPAYCDATGYMPAELTGRDPAFLRVHQDQGQVTSRMWQIIGQKGLWESDIQIRCRDGRIRDHRLRVTAVRQNDDEPAHYVGVYSDITDLKQTQKKLEDLAYYDPLTQLPNRLLFYSRIESAIVRAQENHQTLALVYLDLDNFKNVNDSFGHPLGDDLLIAVTRRLQSHLDERHVLAHLGGDEFALLLEDPVDHERISELTRSLLRHLEAPFDLGQSNRVYMTASAGMSAYPQHTESPVELIQFAHAAMYEAKKLGRRQSCWFTPALVDRASERLRLEARLHNALENNEFVLHYQPLRAGETGEKTVGYEALCRWQPPGEPMIPPDEFIPVAEDSGLIIPLGEWVLREACKQLKAWHDRGGTNLSVSVNLSARQFLTPDITTVIQTILEETGASPAHLHLELTESLLLEQGEDLNATTLQKLKALGVKLVLDDFGTGYSCLAYLRHMPLDLIKIDRRFIEDMERSEDAKQLVMAIISMAQCLHLDILAEGIETQAQLETLSAMGCRHFQGFHFGRPKPAAQICLPEAATASE